MDQAPFLLTEDEQAAVARTHITCEDMMFGSMCLWEVIIDAKYSAWDRTARKIKAEASPFEKAVDAWGDVGSLEQRSTVCSWVRTCEEAWLIARDVYDYDDCYDFEFCPWFIQNCVDHYTWTVKPDWILQVRKLKI